MNSIVALYDKTFGIRNEDWLEKCGLTCLISSISVCLVLLYEIIQNIIVMQIGHKNGTPSDIVVTVHLALYVLFVLFTSVVFEYFEDQHPETRIRNYLIGVPASMVFVTFYLFNPWISHYQSNAKTVHIWFKYSFICAKLLLLIFLISSSVVTWILWRMRRFTQEYAIFEVVERMNVERAGNVPHFEIMDDLNNNMQMEPRISSISVMNCMKCRKFSITCLTSFVIGICLAIYDRYQFTLKKTDSNFFLYYFIGFHIMSLSSYSIYLFTSFIPLLLSLYRKLIFVNIAISILHIFICFNPYILDNRSKNDSAGLYKRSSKFLYISVPIYIITTLYNSWNIKGNAEHIEGQTDYYKFEIERAFSGSSKTNGNRSFWHSRGYEKKKKID